MPTIGLHACIVRSITRAGTLNIKHNLMTTNSIKWEICYKVRRSMADNSNKLLVVVLYAHLHTTDPHDPVTWVLS